MSLAQLDAICELYAEDNPKTFKFWRDTGERVTDNLAAWANRLTGEALARFRDRGKSPELRAAMAAIRAKRDADAARFRAQQEQVGFHKGGQKIEPPPPT